MIIDEDIFMGDVKFVWNLDQRPITGHVFKDVAWVTPPRIKEWLLKFSKPAKCKYGAI
jgi:hypothetical protein